MASTFYLRSPQLNSETSIVVRIRWKKETLILSTGLKIRPEEWNPLRQKVRKSSPYHSELNSFLDNERNLITDALTSFVNKFGKHPSSRQFKIHLQEYREEQKPKPPEPEPEPEPIGVTLYDLFEKIASQHDNRLHIDGKTSKRKAVSSSYRQTLSVLRDFEAFTGRKLNFDSIHYDLYTELVKYCSNQRKFALNTIGKHIKNLKAVMNEAVEQNLTTNIQHKSKKFKVLREDSYNIYLTNDELERIFELQLSDTLHTVRDLFLIGAYTGLRISDFSRIREHHIKDRQFIEIKTDKSKATVKIPLSKNLLEILQRHNYKAPFITEQTLNRLIKEVARLAEITGLETWEKVQNAQRVVVSQNRCDLISSHTARRTFATNAFLEGLPPLTIMSITGHKTEKAFLKYIKATPGDHLKIALKHYEKMGRLPSHTS